jgi:futalosine hydrolase
MKKTGHIGLISAVPFEAALLLKEIRLGRTFPRGITTGVVEGRRIAHISSGMGIANAAHAATLLIEKHSPALVIQFGTGGAYPGSGLSVGDIALAEREVYADLGVLTGKGLNGLEATGIPLLKKGGKKYYNTFSLDKRLLRKALMILGERLVSPGAFLTVSQITGTMKRASWLRKKYNAICENMEGAAVAQVSARYGIPMLEVRGISNMAEDRDLKKWDKQLASENCQRSVIELLGGI